MLRRAADRDELNVFKAFPDLEPSEYLLYHTGTREIAGIQVKSVTFAAGATEAHGSPSCLGDSERDVPCASAAQVHIPQ